MFCTVNKATIETFWGYVFFLSFAYIFALVSEQVKVFTLQGLLVLDGYESYVKKCNGCNIYYRYQEHTQS